MGRRAQRPVCRVKEPKMTGARRARAERKKLNNLHVDVHFMMRCALLKKALIYKNA